MGQATKGLITYRTDSSNNTSWYDSRAVLFKRYESSPGSGVFSIINDNGGASQSILTFSGGCYNIQNGPQMSLDFLTMSLKTGASICRQVMIFITIHL